MEGAAGPGTASAKSARVGGSRQLPGRSAEAGPGAAAPAGEPGPGTGLGGVAAASRPLKAADGESGDEPLVSGDDDGGLPAARVAAGGATADPVRDYLTGTQLCNAADGPDVHPPGPGACGQGGAGQPNCAHRPQ